MKTIKTLCLAMMLASVNGVAQNRTEWLDPEVNQVNRMPMHTYYFAYESEELAMKGDKWLSENIMSLNGIWKFNWVKIRICALLIFIKQISTTSDGAKCQCPEIGK